MALSIPHGIFYSTVDLMAMSLAEVGASVDIAWLGGLWKRTARGFPTARMIVINKPASLTAGFFKNFFRESIVSSCVSC